MLLEKVIDLPEDDALQAIENNDDDTPAELKPFLQAMIKASNYEGVKKPLNDALKSGIEPETIRRATLAYVAAVAQNNKGKRDHALG